MRTILEKPKILIVEDEITQRRILRAKLERQGYEVIEAADGEEGLSRCLDDSDIRLVITDLLMPKMDGFQLLQALRSQEARYAYVIVLTALDDKEALVRALRLGADDYLAKPVNQDELALRLDGARRLLKLESQDELVLALVKLAGSRSGETGSHLARVSAYCEILALDLSVHHPELGLTPNLAKEIAKVAPLHDIGKVGIADSILHKPGKLTAEEYEVMKSHASIGGTLLKEVYDTTGAFYLRLAYEITMFHHERWDGTGYPLGLAGRAIPLPGRIVALSDVFDALSSSRCYKDSFPYEQVKKIVLAESGNHFDPMIVEAYLRAEEAWREVSARFAL